MPLPEFPDTPPQADSTSIYILSRMSEQLKGLKALSFEVTTSYDLTAPGLGLVKYGDRIKAKMLFPDKLLVESHGDKGNKISVYNKDRFHIYDYDKNNYAKLEVSGRHVIEMIDEVSSKYGIEFPAADFFYPDFVNDIKATASQVSFLGLATVNGTECFHIAAKTDQMSWQLWISSDAWMLPVRMVIVYTQSEGSPQYQADFSNWNLNAALPESLFDFVPIYGANEIQIK